MSTCETKSFLRDSCILCALKHLGQAAVIFKETMKGYPDFPIYVRGHMAEAEDELVCDHSEIAYIIREERTRYEANPDYHPNFSALIIQILDYQKLLAIKQLKDMGYDEEAIAEIQAS